jgi:hypothetical protein
MRMHLITVPFLCFVSYYVFASFTWLLVSLYLRLSLLQDIPVDCCYTFVTYENRDLTLHPNTVQMLNTLRLGLGHQPCWGSYRPCTDHLLLRRSSGGCCREGRNIGSTQLSAFPLSKFWLRACDCKCKCIQDTNKHLSSQIQLIFTIESVAITVQKYHFHSRALWNPLPKSHNGTGYRL